LTLSASGSTINPDKIRRDWRSMDSGCLRLFGLAISGLGIIALGLLAALA
jgi:hypothetical protein